MNYTIVGKLGAKEHIKKRHPEDYELFKQYLDKVVINPDYVIKDYKNKNTIFMIKKLNNTNLNVVVKVIIDGDHKNYKNSVITFYRIRDKNLNKLKNKNENMIIYKNE